MSKESRNLTGREESSAKLAIARPKSLGLECFMNYLDETRHAATRGASESRSLVPCTACQSLCLTAAIRNQS